MDHRDRDDRHRKLDLQGPGVERAEPRQIFARLRDLKPRHEILVAADHHHHDAPATRVRSTKVSAFSRRSFSLIRWTVSAIWKSSIAWWATNMASRKARPR